MIITLKIIIPSPPPRLLRPGGPHDAGAAVGQQLGKGGGQGYLSMYIYIYRERDIEI